MRSFLGVSIIGQRKVLGRVYLTEKRPGLAFTQADEQVAESFAGSLAMAMDEAGVAEQLRESETRLKLALEAANDGWWDWDLRTGQVYLSPRWQTMLGFEPGDVEPCLRAWRRLIHPGDRAGVIRTIADHVKGKTVYVEQEYRLRRKSGDYIWILARGKVIESDARARPLRAAGTHTDISERKRAERMFRDLLESAPDAMVITNAAGEMVLVNAQTEALFGHSRSKLIGRPVEMLMPQRYREGHPAHRARFLAEGSARTMGEHLELRGLRRDGSEFPIEVSLSPIEAEGGVLVASGIRILVVDDDSSVADLLGELLAGTGYEVTVQTSSVEALTAFEANPGAVDVVVTDQTMPGLCGMELAGALLKIRPGLPVVLCTGYSEQVDEARAKAAGLRGYLQKPVRAKDLLDIVGELTCRHPHWCTGTQLRRHSGAAASRPAALLRG